MNVIASPGSLTSTQARQLSPASLAYIGDGVYELWIRLHFLLPQKQMNLYHQAVVRFVRAEQQAHLLSQIEGQLTDVERDVVRWGRNAVTNVPKRLDHSTYRYATGFETLIGYLYLTNTERLAEVFSDLMTLLSDACS
ncbi:MAG: ribonuclease III domain-containing protein [Cyanobacteria bacterium J06627_8]